MEVIIVFDGIRGQIYELDARAVKVTARYLHVVAVTLATDEEYRFKIELS
jgi:hypothetical protein